MRQAISEVVEIVRWFPRWRFWKLNWHRFVITQLGFQSGAVLFAVLTGSYNLWALLTGCIIATLFSLFSPLINPDTGKEFFPVDTKTGAKV